MSIKININGFESSISIVGENTNKIENKKETEILNCIINLLSTDFSRNNFEIKKLSDEYTTLKYKSTDIVRVKYTDKTQWLKLYISNDIVNDYINDPLFESQKNKKELFWKTNYNISLSIYTYIIKKACEEIDTF